MHIHGLVLARDESRNLPECVQSLRGLADGVTVADTGSGDETVAVARELGAMVLPVGWQADFAAARNAALARIDADWIVVLDADERLAARSAGALRVALRAASAEVDAVPLEIRTYTDDVGRLGYVGLSSLESSRRGAGGYVASIQPRILRGGRALRYAGCVGEVLMRGEDPVLQGEPIGFGIIHHLKELQPLARRRERERQQWALALRAVLQEPTPAALERLGRLLCEAQRWRAALSYLALVESQPTASPTTHLLAGMARWHLGLHESAVVSLRRSYRGAPQRPEAALWLARTLMTRRRDGADPEAGRLLDAVLEAAPEMEQAVLLKAEWHRKRHELTRARALVQTVLDRNAVHPAGLKELGAILLLQGQAEEAETVLRQALRLRDRDPELHNNLGCALERRGMWSEARAAFTQAVEEGGGDDPRLLRNLCLADAACDADESLCRHAEQALLGCPHPTTWLAALREDLLEAGWIRALGRLERWAVEMRWLDPGDRVLAEDVATSAKSPQPA